MLKALANHQITHGRILFNDRDFSILTDGDHTRNPFHTVIERPCVGCRTVAGPPCSKECAALPAGHHCNAIVAGADRYLRIDQSLCIPVPQNRQRFLHFRLYGAVNYFSILLNPLAGRCAVVGENTIELELGAINASDTGIHHQTNGFSLTIISRILFHKLLQDIFDVFHGFRLFQVQFVEPVFSQPEKLLTIENIGSWNTVQLTVNFATLQASSVK